MGNPRSPSRASLLYNTASSSSFSPAVTSALSVSSSTWPSGAAIAPVDSAER